MAMTRADVVRRLATVESEVDFMLADQTEENVETETTRAPLENLSKNILADTHKEREVNSAAFAACSRLAEHLQRMHTPKIEELG